jgi:hypothetical protein
MAELSERGVADSTSSEPDENSTVISVRDRIFGVLDEIQSQEFGPEAQSKFLGKLKTRINSRPRHYDHPEGLEFVSVERVLKANPELLHRLYLMDETGGEPDVVAVNKGTFIFADCSQESPSGRLGLNYKEALEMADKMGVMMMPKRIYKIIQKKGEGMGVDVGGGSSWIDTKPSVSAKGLATRAFRGFGSGRTADFSDMNPSLPYHLKGWRGIVEVPRIS